MYSHLNFIEPKEAESIDFEELIELGSSDFTYDSIPLESGQVQVTDDGTLIVEGEEHNMLKGAFLGLCKQLRIPDPFAKHIPWDLLKYNIDTLSAENKPIQLFIRDDGVIANVASGNFISVPHADLLTALGDGIPAITRGKISDIGLQIDVVSPTFDSAKGKFKDITVKKGDITKTGLSFHNSTTGYNFTKAMFLLWRLVCTNGMTLPATVGMAKLRAKPNRELDISISNFVEQTARLAINAEVIGANLKGLDRSLNVAEFSKYWKGLRKVVRDPEHIDEHIFEVDEDQRKIWMAQERGNKKKPLEIEMEETSVNGWRMINNLTDQAKSFDQLTQRKLEAFGGKILMGLN